uniref:KIB1-4 beta-propeller domain-containing protein n=1 Tax=Hordeum vulgare subsp. vulgare TaxID=112509 RepID=A0A8I6XPS6_HORVV
MTATSGDTSPWASLPADLVRLVGRRALASDVLDYVCLRATCGHWRSSTASPRGSDITDPRFHPRRFYMLPQEHGFYPHNDMVRLFNSSTGTFIRSRHSLLRYHRVLDSLDGLLLLQQHNSGRVRDIPICLLNPLTGDISELPPLVPSMRPYFSLHPDDREHAASLNFSEDGVITVMIALFKFSRIVFATTGDERWRVSTWDAKFPTMPSLSFQGKIYACYSLADWCTHDTIVKIFEIEPPVLGLDLSSLPPPKLIVRCAIGKITFYDSVDLIECDSEILVVCSKPSVTFSGIIVYKLADLVLGRVAPVASIGGNALFAGIPRSLSVSSGAVPGVVGDAVVQRHPMYGYLRQCRLDSGTWSGVAGGTVSRFYCRKQVER